MSTVQTAPDHRRLARRSQALQPRRSPSSTAASPRSAAASASSPATLDASGDEPRLTGTGVTASLTTGDADRDAHLGNADFFDAELNPELRFASTSFEVDGEDVVVQGDLTLRGATRPVELRGTLEGPVVDAFGITRFGLELAGKIDRTEFGISWNAPLPGGDFLLSNTVRIDASFSLVQAS